MRHKKIGWFRFGGDGEETNPGQLDTTLHSRLHPRLSHYLAGSNQNTEPPARGILLVQLHAGSFPISTPTGAPRCCTASARPVWVDDLHRVTLKWLSSVFQPQTGLIPTNNN
jgi:hypothetical protein